MTGLAVRVSMHQVGPKDAEMRFLANKFRYEVNH